MKTSLKSRRGSTLVMVGILMVAFVGVGAIGADLGRFYVITGEMQTAADAAALAGALTLQTESSASPEAVVDAAVVAFVASTNRSNGSAMSVNPDNVKMAFYTPPSGTTPASISTTLGAGVRPNAVKVQLNSAPTGFFSKLLGRTAGLGLQRDAVAWIANLSSNCVRPMAFPYLPLYNAVMGTALTTPTTSLMDPAKFLDYMNLPADDRMFIVLGQNEGPLDPAIFPNDGEWNGFNFTGNAGRPGFTDGIVGCRRYTVAVDAGDGVTLPGQAHQYVTWANQTIDQLCVFKGSTDAGCYASASATSPGKVINIAFGDVTGTGSNGVDFKYVGEFILTCYYYGNANESCPVTKPGAPAVGYPRGTMVGIMQGLKSRTITSDDVLGNAPSNNQRIILVE